VVAQHFASQCCTPLQGAIGPEQQTVDSCAGSRKLSDKDVTMNRLFLTLGACFLTLAGCTNALTRLQSPDETGKKKEIKVQTIGDVTQVWNADPVMVSGIGLVVDLEGTGGGAPPGGWRTMLEDDLRKRGIDQVKELLNSRDTSLVLVSASIPPGSRKDDPIDVTVMVPRESKTSSLRGGRLLECSLYDVTSMKRLDPQFTGPDRLLRGHRVAKAEGSLLVGFGKPDGEPNLREGRIWGGGRCLVPRPFYLTLNSDQQFARVAKAVAERVNDAFQGQLSGGACELAKAENKTSILLQIPPQYRLNLPRYLRVVRFIPLHENEAERIPYRRQLEDQLLDPARTVVTALRLEALGQDSLPTLKRGLQSKHPLVRFSSAEALAYLGSPSCASELAADVEDQVALRAFSLTALASLDEAICHVELRRLLTSPSAETCYGAFRALRALDEHDEAVQGEQLNDSFWLHRIATDAPPLVHMTTCHRAEVVLFGQDAILLPPFAICAGDFTLTAGEEDTQCTIARISIQRGNNKKQSSFKLEEVIRTLASLEATYPDVAEVLSRIDRIRCLNGRVAVDALPQATSVIELAKAGAENSELIESDPEIVAGKADFGSTPTLFEKRSSRQPSPDDAR
jgi:Flagellar P-ring protein